MRRSLAALLATTLAACAGVQPDPSPPPRPEVAVPPAWAGAAAASEAGWPPADWWTRFGSPELDALVRQVQTANHDLLAAAARVEQARALVAVAAAARYPQLSLDAGVATSKNDGSPPFDTSSLALGAAWELDPWGRNRAALAAAEAGLAASEFSRDALRLELTADAASAYFQLLLIGDSLRIAGDNLANVRRLLAAVEAQQRAGRASVLELTRQRSALANAEAALPPLQQQRRTLLDLLAVLSGRPPAEFTVAERPLASLALPAAPGGDPAGLLERRPDLRQAEAALAGAAADLAAARAAVLPGVQLSARAGSLATSPARLFDPGTGFATLGLDLLATIFDGGRLAGRVALSRERQRELVENYRQAVLSAYRDSEDARAAVEHLASQEAALAEARQHAAEAYRLAEIRFNAGATDYLAVLDAQRSQLAAESALLNVRFFRLSALTNLYRALGGGWEPAEAKR